jgi:hypothetical protein
VSENAAFAYPCPACQAPADLARGCPTCGRGPDPDAAEVVRLDRVIAELVVRERWHREAHAAALAELTDTRRRREAAAARVRVARTVRPPAPTPPPSPPPSPSPAPEPVPVPPGPEASTFSIQTLLFIIGGLLLGTGAIAFTVVAWTTFGRAGQAAILAVVTLLVLAVPAVAQRRGLRGTAETFAVLGLLLVLLDGYAAWRSGWSATCRRPPGPGWCAASPRWWRCRMPAGRGRGAEGRRGAVLGEFHWAEGRREAVLGEGHWPAPASPGWCSPSRCCRCWRPSRCCGCPARRPDWRRSGGCWRCSPPATSRSGGGWVPRGRVGGCGSCPGH